MKAMLSRVGLNELLGGVRGKTPPVFIFNLFAPVFASAGPVYRKQTLLQSRNLFSNLGQGSNHLQQG